MATTKKAYTLDEAAEQAGYSRDTIQRAIKLGDLAARYANKKPVILDAELQDWLESLPTEAPTK